MRCTAAAFCGGRIVERAGDEADHFSMAMGDASTVIDEALDEAEEGVECVCDAIGAVGV